MPGGSEQTVPSGLVSVMPQAWITFTPYSSNAFIIASGTAVPPIAVRFSVVKRLPLLRR